MFRVTRRGLLQGGGALALGAGLMPGRTIAQDPLKVAGIYTVPVEQQWVSRIHQAAEAAKAAGVVDYT
ncbi:MAG: BMP family ABC transporter substrate-binding protein, partial [Burkholderiaceae bacterium]